MPAGNHKTGVVDKELLRRYFAEKAGEEEEAVIRQWLIEPSNQKEVLDFIELSWKEGSIEEEQISSFHQLFERILEEERQNSRKTVPLFNRPWLWAAACAVFLLAGTWMGYHLKDEPQDGWMLTTARTGKGQRTQLLLSDGSEVYLNADSRLTFRKQPDVQQVLYLEGEAYFNIKNAEKPLTIRTKELVTTAKGSKINISAFPGDSTVTVSVEKGKAEVSSSNKIMPLLKLRFPAKDSIARQNGTDAGAAVMPLIKLRPAVVKENQSMVFDKESKIAGVTDVQSDDLYFAWKDGVLTFVNAEPADIVNKLERWYGVKVYANINDVVLYSGEFKHAALKEVLQHISESLNLKHRINKDTVYIYQ